MNFVDIFASGFLLSAHYPDVKLHEYDRLMECWRNPKYLEKFLTANSSDLPDNKTIFNVIDEIIEERYDIQDLILDIIDDNAINLDEFFIQLDNEEYKTKTLSKRKGKTKYLRLYSIRIEKNLHIITGGAIKLPKHHRMCQRPHTKIELSKLDNVKNFLIKNDVYDEDSFFEFQSEFYGD